MRGGSKSIHLKNIKSILGRPLVYWSIDAALGSSNIDKVYIATDSEDIKKCIKSHEKFGVDPRLLIYDRDSFNARDVSTTEDIQLEFSVKFDYENLVFIQAYIIPKKNLEKGRCRLYGKIGTYIMPDYTYYEIDEEYDWLIIEAIMQHHNLKN